MITLVDILLDDDDDADIDLIFQQTTHQENDALLEWLELAPLAILALWHMTYG